MRCAECNLYWAGKGEQFPSCKADPNWPAPCEYDDDDEIEDCYTLEDLGQNWW